MAENKVYQISDRLLDVMLDCAFTRGMLCQVANSDEKREREKVIEFSKSLL